MFHLYDFLIYCFITAYTPGANNLLSISNAIRLGFCKSVRFNFGILAGFAIVMSVCTAFSATLYSFLPKVKIVMQILGAAYMLYLAWKVWKSSSELSADGGKEASFLSGMVLQFANPKIYIYAITAMSLYILPVYLQWIKPGPSNEAAFYGGSFTGLPADLQTELFRPVDKLLAGTFPAFSPTLNKELLPPILLSIRSLFPGSNCLLPSKTTK